ncbi:hypothetical protein [Labedaea rhizosphaerae]|uniref:Uncharacterized protein n=1 Tax=Labedaea rhizosphaerae TaxID=598644 RepID=A0A4R6SEM6_LABRH|nr:hypothetical protein [Labedaea rhizosphaerae]TDP97506.1 hypothetical protein EV186_103470 [Labedaea rhizosphaerae]
MTSQPGDPRAGHHQARNTQELLEAADRLSEQQQQRYSRDPRTDQIPVAGESLQAPANREPESAVAEESVTQQSEPMVEPTVNDPEAEPAAMEQGPGHRAQNTNTDDEHVALFDPHEAQELQSRWREVQTAFVDDPRSAVQGADQLVAQVIQSLTASFAAHKEELEGQWQNSDAAGPATEDLRLALRRYRTLFNQLLNA